MENENKAKKFLVGNVVSDKMEKTIVVEVQRTAMHPIFGKVIKSKKKYKVHDENEIAKVGDNVVFYEGKPVSKTKYMYLEKVMTSESKI